MDLYRLEIAWMDGRVAEHVIAEEDLTRGDKGLSVYGDFLLVPGQEGWLIPLAQVRRFRLVPPPEREVRALRLPDGALAGFVVRPEVPAD